MKSYTLGTKEQHMLFAAGRSRAGPEFVGSLGDGSTKV